MKRAWVGGAILAISLVHFFQFPGHTWLQSDTQIYAPILEHMWDPSVLGKDLIVQHPHVAFTLYDETAVALRKVTGLDFRLVLEGEQFVFRALGIWGVYLIATAMGLSDLLALLVTAVFSLGAFITGPSVVVYEYEPVPRGFAVPMVFLAIGLVAHQRFLSAAMAAAVGFLMHPPSVVPFWVVYFCLAVWPSKTLNRKDRLAPLWVLAGTAVILLAASFFQDGSGKAFFSRLDPHQAELQRMRASYNWVSTWWRDRIAQYLILYAVTVLAYGRVRQDAPQALRFFLIGLPLIGVISVPVSYVLLEKLQWAVVPEFQPGRALLFVTAFAMILGAIAACKAVTGKRYDEAIVLLALAYLPPANRLVEWPSWNRVAVVLILALLTTTAIWTAQAASRWSRLGVTIAAAAPFFLIPLWGGMENYPALHTAELEQLAHWARTSTPKDAVFLFPDAKESLDPGIFRAEALRAVYVDWKAGGQVNFFKELGEEWWSRWQKTMASPFNPAAMASYRSLGIDYVVLLEEHRISGMTPVFENGRYVAYKAP
ncbi:MAG TPA: DUF6798 domain-containing protein [Bryobacteraceae bacterium]|nr:DUF6798 domain-containing protein [Bryobacteraceae bacterium]